jgi:glycosyltransferase involved in cell wall biosynthesis
MQTARENRGIGEDAARELLPPARLELQRGNGTHHPSPEVAILTGGQDRHYTVGLGTALMAQDFDLDIIGSNEIDGPEFQGNPHARFHNFYGAEQSVNLPRRIGRILSFYARLFRYALTAEPKIFHILWNNKLPTFDRTLLMLFYKLAGKKVVLTAHNVNAGRRDKKDSSLNRITLRCQYALADHLFVHTKKMKDELLRKFDVAANKVTVIPYGINNAVPSSELTREDARRELGLRNDEKAVLYFGAIKRYKGLETLVAAFQQIAARADYRLIIAGERKKGHEDYWRSIQQTIERDPNREKILQKIKFIPDPEIAVYFKAADVAVLPYTDIFQSGVLFLAYAYGLPVIATDVGSFSEDIVEGRTGFICKPGNPGDLATTIQRYFDTELYRELECRRQEIREYTLSRHSWSVVADATTDVYSKLLGRVY